MEQEGNPRHSRHARHEGTQEPHFDLDAPVSGSVGSKRDIALPVVDDASSTQAGGKPVISFDHVTHIYPAQPKKPALDDLTLKIFPGEFLFLVGHSGSG